MVTLINATPPKFAAGCNGIEIGFGSISFLDFDNLVAKLKMIASAAPAFAFKMAIDTVCSQCSTIMQDIEQIVEDLKIYKNSQLGLPTFVVTSILSGDESSPNKTADFAELVVDCRLTPELEEVFEQVMSELAVQYHFT